MGLRVRNVVDLTALARRAGNSVAITFDDLVHNLFDGYAVRAGWVDSDVKVPSLNTPAQVKNVVQLGRVSLTVYALIKGDAQETYEAKHNWVTTVDGDRYMSDSDIQVLADGIVTDLVAARSHPSDRTTPGGPTRRTPLPPSVVDYTKLLKADLQTECRTRGVLSVGTANTLMERLGAYDEGYERATAVMSVIGLAKLAKQHGLTTVLLLQLLLLLLILLL